MRSSSLLFFSVQAFCTLCLFDWLLSNWNGFSPGRWCFVLTGEHMCLCLWFLDFRCSHSKLNWSLTVNTIFEHYPLGFSSLLFLFASYTEWKLAFTFLALCFHRLVSFCKRYDSPQWSPSPSCMAASFNNHTIMLYQVFSLLGALASWAQSFSFLLESLIVRYQLPAVDSRYPVGLATCYESICAMCVAVIYSCCWIVWRMKIASAKAKWTPCVIRKRADRVYFSNNTQTESENSKAAHKRVVECSFSFSCRFQRRLLSGF